MGFQTRSLVQQGYSTLTRRQLESLEWGLRFTPAVCMAASMFAIATHNGPLLVGIAALGIVPFWFPTWHPIDRFYNHVVAPLFGSQRLPPNPLPRRIACFSGGSMNLLAAIAVFAGAYILSYAIGVILWTLQLIVTTTHFCLASWGIEMGLKAFGRSLPTALIDGADAVRLAQAGALLLDVRDESEFAQGHLPGAQCIPVATLRRELPRLRSLDRPIIVYCQSGGRSKLAHGLLVQAGVGGVHNLGGVARWPGGLRT
jgi:rhodanese-related sulfurtransferase